jgi:glucose uptake protein GlcU
VNIGPNNILLAFIYNNPKKLHAVLLLLNTPRIDLIIIIIIIIIIVIIVIVIASNNNNNNSNSNNNNNKIPLATLMMVR